MRATWRADWPALRRGTLYCPFIDDPISCASLLGTFLTARGHIGHYSIAREFSSWSYGGVWPLYPCMMNPTLGSPSHEIKQHPKEESDTESEDLQPKDMTTDKGYKIKTTSLPFSVESLISKKTTCRTVYSSSESRLVQPKPVAAQGGQFSPRTFYAERKVSAESSQNAPESPSDDSPEFCEKDQSTWFQTSSFSTPPRKLFL